MLKLVEQLNDADTNTLIRFEIAGQHVGYIRRDLAEKLLAHAPNFLGQVDANTIAVIANLDAEQLTEAFKMLHDSLHTKGILPKPANEFMDVRAKMTDEPLCQINRSLLFPLGIISRGVHVILQHENGDFVVARRSDKVFTFKGAYDVSVGGGLPSGVDPWEHVKAEAAQEGGFGAKDIQPDGEAMVIEYIHDMHGYPVETDGGTNWDQVFYWTATIPNGVKPTPRDGEVKSFERMSPEVLAQSLRKEPEKWKTNSGVMLLKVLADKYHHLLTPKERLEVAALVIPDPRPVASRGELKGSAHNIVSGNKPQQ